MKLNYLNVIIMICLLILVSGCGKEKDDENIVESINGDAAEEEESSPAEAEESEESDSITEEDDVLVIEYDEETGTNADLVAELMKDLVDEDKFEYDTEEEEEEMVVSDDNEIVIENFRGNPMDIVIEKGSTVKWTNLMYFKHIIIILPDQGDGTFGNRWINEDLTELWVNESYEFAFEESGRYQWGSKTKFEVTKGIVTVVD
jgi:plastocyanin